MPDTAAGRPPRGVIAVAGEALVDIVPVTAQREAQADRASTQQYWELAPGGSPANVAVGPKSRVGTVDSFHMFSPVCRV